MRWSLLLPLLAAGCGGSRPATQTQEPAPENVRVAPPLAEEDTGARVRFEDEDRAYVLAVVKDLRQTGEHDKLPGLVELADHIAYLVEQVDGGQLTKRQLLEAMAAAEDRMTDPIGNATELQLDDVREAMRRVKTRPARAASP